MIRYLFIAGYLLSGFLARSQAPVSNFSASPLEGCSPLMVTFKDVSTGDPKFWNWDFGNGQLSSVQNPPAVFYNTPGKYTVTLVVRNANGTNGVTKTDYITVNPSPTAQFTSNLTNACSPANIQFTDQSVSSIGTISQWEWNFGDGTTSNLQNPSKRYNANGFYTVTLTVASSTGCKGNVTKSRYIRVVSGVKAAFADSINRVCQPPFTGTFKNGTSGPGSLSYSWDFGNGGTSTAKDPAASYSATGSYTVRLIARSDLGCGDTLQKNITISSANTSFSNPDSACLNSPVTFTNTSTPKPISSVWYFSDGTQSQQPAPSKTFTTAGTYQVKLVNTYTTCTDSLTKTINVLGPPPVNFTSNSQGGCRAPFTAVFQDQSASAVSWIWNFGDGTPTSNQKNPTHVYTNAGEFDVSLTITTSFGCRNTVTKTKFIKINPPTVSISNAPAGGCAPFTFSPVASINAVDGVASYLWDFGDGGPTSNLPNPSRAYPNPGSYTIKLTITTQGGCTASVTVPNGVRTGTPVAANFISDTLQACADSTIRFINQSSGNPNEFAWDFGDDSTSTLKDPLHKYKSSGAYTVALTASNNGCANTIRKIQYITVLPPTAKFNYTVNCSNKTTVQFVNESSTSSAAGGISYDWHFGDGGATSNAASPTYTYPATGSYTVRLTVTNGACKNTFTKQVYILAEKADFTTSKSSVCKNERFTISATNSSAVNIAQYQWSVNGGTPFVAPRSFDTSFSGNGSYNIILTITDNNGCTDPISKTPVTVVGPVASFSLSATSGCRNSLVTINDQSSGDITKWTFDFGDGTIQSFTNPPFTHLFKDTGNFSIRLTVQDKAGCIDALTLENALQITSPVVAFKADKTSFCPGAPLQFTDSSKSFGSSSYVWSFGDGGTSSLQNPTHAYMGKDSIYSVQLIVQDLLGCADTLRKANYIQIKTSKLASEIKDSVAICPPLETTFFFKGQNYESYYWDFGDSSSSISLTKDTILTHFYNDYGRYTAKLFVVGPGGCLDSREHIINIYNPYANPLTYSPLTACNSLLVNFNFTPPPQTSIIYAWGDGVQDSSQTTNAKYLYKAPGSYVPFVIMTDTFGCRAQVYGTEYVKVIGAEPLFSADRKAFCDSGTVYFTNYTIGNDPITSSIWDFGDGSSSTAKDPIHDYTKNGQYIVSLSVTTENGCSKTLTDTVRVYATPQPSITSDNVACINSPVVFQGVLAQPDSSVIYNWNLGNGQTSTQQNPMVNYSTEGNYTVTLEAVNAAGCKTSTKKDIIVAPLPVITIKADPVIPIGSGIQIPVTYSPNVTAYNWTPAGGLSCTNCPNPIANPKINTTYTVSVTDSNGCVSSKEIIVSVVCNSNNYFVPNTFTPNGDGNNDVFFPRGSNVARVQSMRIFNRWGEIVFEKRNFSANNPGDGWNGSYKGKAVDADVYVYLVEFICENGAIIPFKGNVTLIR